MTIYRRCPKCNEPNEPGTIACAYCGAELVRRCPNCGTPRPWNVALCPNCQIGADDTSLFTDLFRRARTGVVRQKYSLIEPISAGPVSIIYRATDVRNPEQTYAIKEISTVSLFRADERREAESSLTHAIERWSATSHPGIAPILDVFQDQDRFYVVSEYVYGWSGEQIISDIGLRAAPELVRNWGAQACDLLSYLHGLSEPLYVPFLSPAHVIFTPDGQVRLVGYGLGYHVRPASYGPYGGLPGYGAPELAHQSPDAQTDVFSLGRTVYALLIDRPLEKGLPRGLNLQQAVPGISTQLVRIVAQAATSRRERRFATATALRQALWPESRGILQPIPGWYQQSRTGLDAVPTGTLQAPGSAARASMEDMGYARDPRYGPRQVPGVAGIASPQEPTPASTARMSLSPTRISIRDLPATGIKRIVLSVRNAGGDELVFRLASQVPWLKAPNKQVTLAADKQARVVLSLDPAAMRSDRVSEPQALLVESNVGRQWIGATVQIKTAPLLRVEPMVLDFGQLETGQAPAITITVSNDGRERLEGQIAPRVSWLEAKPAAIQLPAAASGMITVRVLPDRLPDGPQDVSDALIVDSNGGQATIAARAWQPNPRLELAGALDFRVTAGSVEGRELVVRNIGDGVLTGTARTLVPWLQVTPESILCAAGSECPLHVTADTTGLADGIVQIPQALRIQTNGGAATLSARLQVSAPRLALEPRTLEFGQVTLGQTAARNLTVRNTGSAPLTAAIASALDWIHPSSNIAVCAPGESQTVTITVDTARLGEGGRLEIPSAVRIASGSDIQAVGLNIIVLQPLLAAEPAFVDFGYLDPLTPGQQEIVLRNEGTGDLAWHAQSDAEWLELEPSSGRCAEGATASIRLRAYALGLEAGLQQASGTLAITSDAGRIKVPLRVALAAPRIALDRTFVDLGISVNRSNISASVRIFNRGLGLLRGTAISDRLWLVTDRTSFECDTGHSIELGIQTDMDEFPEDLTEDRGIIRIESNGGSVDVDTRVQIERRPALREPDPVVLKGSDRLQGRLILRNDGMATAHVQISSEDARLSVSRDQVEVKQDKSVRISVAWEDSEPPTSELYLDVRSDVGQWRVPVIWE